MAEDGKKPKEMQIFGGIAINLAIAFVLAWLIRDAAVALGFDPKKALMADLAVFFAVIHADRAAIWRERRGWREIWPKLAVGLGTGALILVAMPPFDAKETVTDTAAASETGKTWAEALGKALLLVLPMALIFPLMFFGPLAERMLKPGDAGRPDAQDFQIGAVFPIYVTFSMSLNLLIPKILWLLGMTAPVAFAVAMLGSCW